MKKDIKLLDKTLEFRILSDPEFKIYPEDLRLISCDGKQCDPVICFRSTCKIHEYWRGKKDGC